MINGEVRLPCKRGCGPIVECNGSCTCDLGTYVGKVVARYPSLRMAARRIGIDAGYLCRLRSGEYDNPSDEILGAIGLRRVVVYETLPKESENG